MRTRFAGVAQLVERNLAKVEVESSRLFSRSKSEGKHSGFPSIISSSSFALRRDSKMVMQRIANPPIPVRFWVSPPNKPARVVKLVDTTDLKSVGWVKPPYRFDSGSGHQNTAYLLDFQPDEILIGCPPVSFFTFCQADPHGAALSFVRR